MRIRKKTCIGCRKVIHAKKRQKWCSDECKNEKRQNKCVCCLKMFRTKYHSKRKYCDRCKKIVLERTIPGEQRHRVIVEIQKKIEEKENSAQYKYRKKYMSESRYKSVEYARQRRARKRNVLVEPYDFGKICEQFGHKCIYCGDTQKQLEADHFIPISKRGADIAENIVPSCKSCNSSKNNKLIVFDQVWLDKINEVCSNKEIELIYKNFRIILEKSDCQELFNFI